MSRSAIGAFSASRPPQRYDFQDESSFRNSLKKYLDQLSQAITSDVLGPSGIPIVYDGATDVLTISSNVEITGALDLDATGPGALVQASAGGVVTADNPLRTAFGGTGLTTFGAAGRLLYSTAAGVLAALAIGGSGTILRSNGSLPVYSTATFADTYARGDVLIATAANTVAGLTIGTSAKYLRSNGTDPAWATINASEITTGNLPYAQLPTGVGSWNTGGGLITITNALTVSGLLTASGKIASPLTIGTGASPITFTEGTNASINLGGDSSLTRTTGGGFTWSGAGIGSTTMTLDSTTLSLSVSPTGTIESIGTTTGAGRLKARGNVATTVIITGGSTLGGTTFGGVSGNDQSVIEAQNASSMYIGTSSAISMYLAPNRIPMGTFTTSGLTLGAAATESTLSINIGSAWPFIITDNSAGARVGELRFDVVNAQWDIALDGASGTNKRISMTTAAWKPVSNAGMTLGTDSEKWGQTFIASDGESVRIKGTSNADSYIGFRRSTDDAVLGKWGRLDSGTNDMGVDLGDTAATFRIKYGGTTRFFFSAGNDNNVKIQNDGSQFTGVYLFNNTTQKVQMYWDQTNTKFIFGTSANAQMGFTTNNTEYLRITAGGDLGIVAAKKFNVDGVAATGDTYITESSGNVFDFVSGGKTVLSLRGQGDPQMVVLNGSAAIIFQTHTSGVGFFANGDFGSGDKVIFIKNATTNPSTNPTAGGILYADSGALKWRGSSGTVTTIANA